MHRCRARSRWPATPWPTAPAGLLTDFDGTISPIVTEPGLARLVTGADGALAALAEQLEVVAIITGRLPLEARRLTGVPGILIAGNHGMEWLEPDEAEPTARSRRRAGLRPPGRGPRPHSRDAGGGARAQGDLRIGPLPHGAGPRCGAVGDRAMRSATSSDHGLRIGHGRMIVEVRPVGLGDKGSAARAIVERFGLRGVVVLGDDVTDIDMFRAVDELRSAGRLRGAIIGVGGMAGEVLPALVAASDVVLADPAEAAALLTALSR